MERPRSGQIRRRRLAFGGGSAAVAGGLCRHCFHLWLRWPQPGEAPQILGGRREQELVLRAAWTTQPQPPELQDALEMGEQHFDLFPTAAGDLKSRRGGKGPRDITGVFVDIPRNLARDIIRAALRLEFADVAILLARAVTACAVSADAGARRGVGASKLNQFFTRRTGVAVCIRMPREVRARERAVGSRRVVKDRNVRRDLLLLDEPRQVLRPAIGCVGGEIAGLEA